MFVLSSHDCPVGVVTICDVLKVVIDECEIKLLDMLEKSKEANNASSDEEDDDDDDKAKGKEKEKEKETETETDKEKEKDGENGENDGNDSNEEKKDEFITSTAGSEVESTGRARCESGVSVGSSSTVIEIGDEFEQVPEIDTDREEALLDRRDRALTPMGDELELDEGDEEEEK